MEKPHSAAGSAARALSRWCHRVRLSRLAVYSLLTLFTIQGLVRFSQCSQLESVGPPQDPRSSAEAVESRQAALTIPPLDYAGKSLIILSIDTLRADHLPVYGYPRDTAPSLSRMAAEGIVFEGAFAPRGHTWPSLTTLFTSQSPRSTNVRGPGELLPDGFPTALGALSDAGYPSAAFLANYCEPARSFFDEVTCGEGQEVVSQSIAWLKAHSEAQPFVLWVHVRSPHAPYAPAAEYDRFTRADYAGEANGGLHALRNIYTQKKELAQADLDHILGLYDGEVLTGDTLLGGVYEQIMTLGLGDRSLIVFTSDHGEDLYEHNKFFEHACSIYDTTLRVPLVIRFPDLRFAGKRIPDVLGLIDLMPTLLDALGVPKLDSFEGESFAELISHGKKKRFRGVISEHYREQQAGEILSIRTEGWRYIYNPKQATPFCRPRGDHYPIAKDELYDHRIDPDERHNVAHLHPEIVAELKAELLSRHPLRASRPEPIRVDDEATLDRLRALGYIVDE